MLVLGLSGCGATVSGGGDSGGGSGQGKQPQQVQACGGFAGKSCPEGQTCVDDPSDECDPAHGGADCMGICQASSPPPQECAGFAGLQCPAGETCVDNPQDGCTLGQDPDCGGICQKP